MAWMAAGVAVAGGGIARVSEAASLRQEAAAEPAKSAPEPFTRVCGKCHAVEIVQGRRLRSQWGEVIEEMFSEGAVGSDADVAVIVEYLVSEYGRVNVNVAPASELAQVIRMDAAGAELIVEYRRTKGKFEDFAALVAIPGVPVEALSKRRDALVF